MLLVEPGQLADLFGPLISIYEANENGRPLIEWLRKDWGMFDHESMQSDAKATALLGEMVGNSEFVARLFAPSAAYETDSLSRWEKLRDELMFGNRFFPEAEIRRDRLAELLELLILDNEELPTSWYRARLLTQTDAFPINEMKAPPARKATHGRANPAGIPYFYLASTAKTAVAEIRPHTGDRACIAEFTTPTNLKIVDLRNPRKSVSPLDFGDEEKIGLMRSDLGFLARLGDELTHPVVPQSAAIDYVPSQYLCEFIKKCAHNGVIYRSSVGDGINMALFSDAPATGGNVAVHVVSRVHVEIDGI